MEQTCVENAKRGYRIRKAISVRSFVFLWTWTRKSVVPYEFGQTSRRMGSQRQENDTAVGRSFSFKIFGAEQFLKGDLKSKKARRPFTFRVRFQQRQRISALFWHATNYTPLPQCVCVKTKKLVIVKLPELSEADLTNSTHHKDPTSSGDRMRDSKHSETIAQVPEDAGFPAEVGKGQYFVTQTLNQERRNMDTCLQEYALLRSTPDSKLLCALCDNVRSGPVLDTKTMNLAGDYSLLKSWYH